MKRIIPLLAVAIAMAVPATLSADDYYGYDDAQKVICMQWVVDAIDAGSVTFSTTQDQADFLSLCDDLFTYAAASNWSACVTTASSLATASSNIVGENHRTMSEYLGETTAEAFTYMDATLLMSEATESEIQDILDQPPGPGTPVYKRVRHHVKANDPYDCWTYWCGEGLTGRCHLGACCWVILNGQPL